MDKKQIEMLIISFIGATLIIAFFLVHEYIPPQTLRQGLMITLILCFIGLAMYTGRLRQNIPGRSLREFTSMMWLLTIFVLAPTLFNFFDKTTESPDWTFPTFIIVISLWSAYNVFREQQKRIEKLEKELNYLQKKINGI